MMDWKTDIAGDLGSIGQQVMTPTYNLDFSYMTGGDAFEKGTESISLAPEKNANVSMSAVGEEFAKGFKDFDMTMTPDKLARMSEKVMGVVEERTFGTTGHTIPTHCPESGISIGH